MNNKKNQSTTCDRINSSVMQKQFSIKIQKIHNVNIYVKCIKYCLSIIVIGDWICRLVCGSRRLIFRGLARFIELFIMLYCVHINWWNVYTINIIRRHDLSFVFSLPCLFPPSFFPHFILGYLCRYFTQIFLFNLFLFFKYFYIFVRLFRCLRSEK